MMEPSLPSRISGMACSTAASPSTFAHRNLVVHRDIKPGNVLVDEAGQAKLVDFGVAKLVAREADGLTLAGTRPLTVRFEPPKPRTASRIPPPPTSIRSACCSTRC